MNPKKERKKKKTPVDEGWWTDVDVVVGDVAHARERMSRRAPRRADADRSSADAGRSPAMASCFFLFAGHVSFFFRFLSFFLSSFFWSFLVFVEFLSAGFYRLRIGLHLVGPSSLPCFVFEIDFSSRLPGFNLVLPGFTWFYLILPGFTWFYLLLSGFT